MGPETAYLPAIIASHEVLNTTAAVGRSLEMRRWPLHYSAGIHAPASQQ